MINIGTNLSLRSQKISYSKEQGFRTVTEYEGTIAAARAFAFQLNNTVSWNIDDSEAPKATLTISAPFLEAGNQVTEQPVDTWELPGNSINKDIYEHATSLALTAQVLGVIKACVNTVQSSSSDTASEAYSNATGKITEVTTTPAAVAAGISQANALELFDLVLKGTSSYQASQYVLRYTRTVGSNSAITASGSNVGVVYQVSHINTESAIPSTITTALNTIPALPVRTGYKAGWLKQTPTIRQISGGKVEITTEWWFENWSTYIYTYLT